MGEQKESQAGEEALLVTGRIQVERHSEAEAHFFLSWPRAILLLSVMRWLALVKGSQSTTNSRGIS